MMETQTPVSIKIPFTTILALLLSIGLIRMAEMIAPLFLPLLIAIFISVSLTPILRWLVKKRWPRKVAIGFIALLGSTAVLVLLIAILPSLYRQLISFVENLPQFREDILKKIGSNSLLREFISRTLQKDTLLPKTDQIKQILGAGNIVLGGFTEIILILILSIYLIADGPRLIEWLSAFFEQGTQKKIDVTCKEVSKIISAYVLGQFLTSALASLFVFICMICLRVTNASLLATLAGVFDVLPILGFFLSVIPAMLFAAGISMKTCLAVLGLYVFYHALENYLIAPLVYGNRMRVSSFVVFFSLLASGLIGGIEGAIVVLPIVASYPIAERVWLRRFVRKEAVEEHSPLI